MTRVLGIDPGSRITGFGLVDVNGRDFRYLESGCIRMSDADFPQRLRQIFTGITQIVEDYQPDMLAIEKVFVKNNVASALKLGQARGAAICAAVMGDLQVSEYSPTEVKKAIVGNGRAGKEQVQHMVCALLQLKGLPQVDASDALAIALCHGQLFFTQNKINLQQQSTRRRR